ncbi:alpha-amylase family glycosyl hydrolase [Phaeodactylibacter luteus]|uniref:T9SS type A sorting domain-containing protein n=1 Tax=Phaeodactylibacter luteus TaxID=1564516 RepID=A0A5C6RVD5_9BACT|nr:alpha-amylase family glycosyl hydrolase [Phaeodactylibacter luteus]TXB66328.1 T9SS type A sorting domain-containing protein [Phaeodactylibacter luteus]
MLKFLQLTFLTFALGWSSPALAQVVYSEPAFPTASDEVTLFFNAAAGNGGLEDCNCNVYLHTGVITEQSTAPSDWRYVPTTWGQANAAWQMQPVPGEANLYQYTFSPSVREYYNVPAGEAIEQMAFVFRNATGSQTGRAEGGGDIFLELFEEGGTGFNAALQSPGSNAIIAQSGSIIPVRVAATEEASITITDNGEELISTVTSLLEYDLTAGGEGTHLVEITVANDEDVVVLEFAYAVPLDLPAMDVPAGLEPGITFSEGTLQLNLFAPDKSHIFVLGSFNSYRPLTEYQMTPSPSGHWWIEIPGLDEEGPHTFQYLVDGEIRVADPYSTVVLDPGNDPFIGEEVYPNLPAYPDNAQGIVSLVDPQVAEYDWQVEDFQRPAKERLVIYELLVRDFLASHSYTDLIDTLDYLSRLGINAIELMPVNEFEGNISWGYNPSFHMALDKYYGPIYEFKRLVDACHARGIAVILDVVYNHAFSQSPLAQLYWDENNFRPAADNPWLNVTPKHPFNVGYDFNHESLATREFVKRTIRYWLEEMKLDGFRFDLSKGFTQVENTDVGAWSAYDASRLVILKDYADEVWNTTPGAYAIMEHFGSWEEELEMAEYGEGMLMWNNMQPQYKNAVLGFGSNLGGASYLERGWETPGLVSFMESHDEERLMYEALEFGNMQGGYNVRELETALSRVEAGALMFYTIPGPKMLWQFGEQGYDFSINYCEDGSINEDCRTGPKPIRWDYLEEEARRHLYERMSEIILLTRSNEIFQSGALTYELNGSAKKIQLEHEGDRAVAVANFGMTAGSVPQAFTQTGWWYEYFTGDSLQVLTPNQLLPLEPGEYRLYTTSPLETPVSTAEAEAASGLGLRLSPNPAQNEVWLSYDLTSAAAVRAEVYNLQGQQLQAVELGQQPSGWHISQLPLSLPQGLYIVRLTAGLQAQSAKLIVR